MIKIGIIDYINALPFFVPFQKKVFPIAAEFTLDVPSRLNAALSSGQLDISMISSIEYLNHRQSYVLMPHYCIGAEKKVDSVSLYTRLPIEHLTGKTIALTTESATSVQLLKVLCRHYWKIEPHFIQLNDSDSTQQYDAFLLIGDKCLMHPLFPGYTTIDLAESWFHATSLPFTFAVFAMRQEVYDAKQQLLEELQTHFSIALNWAKKNSQEIETYAMKKTSLSREVVRHYYSLLRYDMNKQQKKGLEKFAQLSINLHD